MAGGQPGPNDWQKQLKGPAAPGGTAPQITPLNVLRRDYFAAALTAINTMHPGIRMPARANANWLAFANGPFGYWSISVTQGAKVRLEAYLDSGDQERNKALFDQVEAEVDSPTGLSVCWERMSDKRASRLAVYYDHVPPYDEAGLAAAVEWARNAFALLYATYDSELRTRATALRATPPAVSSSP